jgi:hypothetical protein
VSPTTLNSVGDPASAYRISIVAESSNPRTYSWRYRTLKPISKGATASPSNSTPHVAEPRPGTCFAPLIDMTRDFPSIANFITN